MKIATMPASSTHIQEQEAQKLLHRIRCPRDVKNLNPAMLKQLATEVREFLIHALAQTGGHVAPNLGIVELTLAMHKVFSLPRDQILWDVGHQVYVHKMLTGRQNRFNSLRQFGGITGFSSREESIYDCFTTGHGGTSISTAFGKAAARDLSGGREHIMAVIGDGSLTEGMALEGLNHLGHTQTRMIVILNDNGMSIAPNVGGYSRYLDRVRDEPMFRSSKDYLRHLVQGIPSYGDRLYQLMSKFKDSFKYLMTPGVIFEELGIRYIGPVDGHNIEDLIEVFEEVKGQTRPILIHVKTTKGKGFTPAEDTSCQGAKWHGGGPFDPASGQFVKNREERPTYSKIFGNRLVELARKDFRVAAITAAMPDGTGLSGFSRAYPSRFFDVAMAEQHAVGYAAGLASRGLRPFAAIYSTFLQRAYDQIMHEVCLQNLPVCFCLDRSGLVGADGPTHHGVFDLAYLRCLPGLTVMAPRDQRDFEAMLDFMHGFETGPTAIRYPRGEAPEAIGEASSIELGRGQIIRKGTDIALLCLGFMVQRSLEACDLLRQEGFNVTIVDMRFLKPLDLGLLEQAAKDHRFLITLEDGTIRGGFGSAVLEGLQELRQNRPVLTLGLPDEFIPHGDLKNLHTVLGLTPIEISNRIQQFIRLETEAEGVRS